MNVNFTSIALENDMKEVTARFIEPEDYDEGGGFICILDEDDNFIGAEIPSTYDTIFEDLEDNGYIVQSTRKYTIGDTTYLHEIYLDD